MIYILIYLIVGMLVAGVGVISAGQTVAKMNKYHIVAVFIVCILLAVVISPVWPVLVGFAFSSRKDKKDNLCDKG